MKLSELKAIAEARTRGEWHSLPKTRDSVAKEHHIVGVHASDCKIYHERLDPECIRETHERQRADAEFIATMANHIDALLEVVEQAKYVFARGDKKYCEIQDLGDALDKLEALK